MVKFTGQFVMHLTAGHICDVLIMHDWLSTQDMRINITNAYLPVQSERNWVLFRSTQDQ